MNMGKVPQWHLNLRKHVRNAGTTDKTHNKYPENKSDAKTVSTWGFRPTGIRTCTVEWMIDCQCFVAKDSLHVWNTGKHSSNETAYRTRPESSESTLWEHRILPAPLLSAVSSHQTAPGPFLPAYFPHHSGDAEFRKERLWAGVCPPSGTDTAPAVRLQIPAGPAALQWAAASPAAPYYIDTLSRSQLTWHCYASPAQDQSAWEQVTSKVHRTTHLVFCTFAKVEFLNNVIIKHSSFLGHHPMLTDKELLTIQSITVDLKHQYYKYSAVNNWIFWPHTHW